jgi:hypothetical protein
VTAPLLASRLFVPSAFLVNAAVAAAAGIEAALLAALPVAFLLALATAGCAIVLGISSGRMLSGAFTRALFHTLISFSVVCHLQSSPDCWLKKLERALGATCFAFSKLSTFVPASPADEIC